jgi:predicted ATPase
MVTITKLNFNNYKGFETGFLEFKSLNLLIGANSTGKSSILKLLLLFSQSLSNNKAALFQYKGGLVDLGDKKNIYKNESKQKELEFGFSFDEAIDFKQSIRSCTSSFRIRLRSDARYLIGLTEKVVDRESMREIVRSGFDPGSDKLLLLAEYVQRSAKLLPETQLDDVPEGEARFDYSAVADALRICGLLSKLTINRISYTVRNNKEKDSPEIVRIRLFEDDRAVVQLKLGIGKNLGKRVSFEMFDQRKAETYHAAIKDMIRFRSFQCTRRPNRDVLNQTLSGKFQENPIGTLFATIFERASRPISTVFDIKKIRHVSPLRAYPKRYYLVDSDALNENFETDSESERIVKLFRENKELLANVNEWLNYLGQNIEIEKIHESVYQILSSNRNLKTDLTNVGFGLSQILPVLVEPLVANEGDIVILQQPEIHLHPKAQSVLGDFFIWVAKKRKITLFIETHSEYLLRRVRRRTAEGAKDALLPLSIEPTAVSILSIEKEGTDCRVAEVAINEHGGFKWPKDFLENELDDLISYLDSNSKPLVVCNVGAEMQNA